MPQIRLIRVFLSSPGDVTDERQIVDLVIKRLPNRPSFREAVTFRVIAWDEPGADTPMRASLTPQEAINQGLPRPSECDIVVVLFWSRMGTPFTHTDGKIYESGTHWELLDALNGPHTETVIYRRMEEKLFRSDDRDGQEQCERLKDFFESDLFFKDGQIVRGVNAYSTPDDFRQKFETHFETLVLNILRQEERASTPEAAAERADETEAPAEPAPESPNIVTIQPAAWPPGKSPFPGLRAFTEADAPIFFGRGRETDELVRQVAKSRFVAVVGASGSGKSSLVGAGLIPRLRANAISDANVGSKDWLIARFTPGMRANPFEALAAALMETVPALASDNPRTYASEVENFAADLQGRPDRLALTIDHALQGEKTWVELLLFIDQFEELFTLAQTPYVAPFAAMLAEVVRCQRVRVVATMRADFYPRAVPHEDLAELLREGSFPLAAPKRDALREMILRPAEQAGLAFEDGLVEQILDDTGDEPGNLALMAYLLDELVRSGSGDQQLTLREYRDLGGVQGAIGERAEAAFAGLAGDAQAAFPTVFRELVEVDERGEPIRRRASLEALAADAGAGGLIQRLTDERLLVTSQGDTGAAVEVAHEALLRSWGRLRLWIDEQARDLQLRRRLEDEARAWKEADDATKSDFVLLGSRLEEAERWLTAFPATADVRAFIDASIRHQDEQIAKENKRKDDLDTATKRARSATIGVAVVIAIALIVGLLVTSWASSQIDTANKQVATADAELSRATATLGFVQDQGRQVAAQATYFGLEQARVGTLVAGVAMNPLVGATHEPTTFLATLTQVAELNAWLPVSEEFDGVEMVKVPKGCFWMGSALESDAPPHEFCFDTDFWIDKYEVSNEQYRRVTGNEPPSRWTDDQRPVEQITWIDAYAFCEARGARLPTEAEWEYAARGPDSWVYPWGNEWNVDKAVWGGNSNGETAEIGSIAEGASWVGAYDMSGNVWEWVQTIYDQDRFPYPYNVNDGRDGYNETGRRVLRGGSWFNGTTNLRASNRGGDFPGFRGSYYGFRCARSS